MSFNQELQAITQSIKDKNFAPIYLLQGSEEYFIDQIEEQLRNAVISKQEKSFNETIFYGEDASPNAIVDAAQRFPMMAKRQLILVREANSLSSWDPIRNYAAEPNPTTVLVFCYKHGKLNGNLKVAKEIKKNGLVMTTKEMRDYEMTKWMQSYFKSAEIHIEPEEISLLQEHLGTKLSNVENELKKLRLHLPKGSKVTKEDIEEHIGISKEYNMFELQDAIGERDHEAAMKIAFHFASNPKKYPIPMLVGSLCSFFEKIHLVHGTKGKSPKEVKNIVGVYHDFILSKYKKAAEVYTPTVLSYSFDILYEFDLRAKGMWGKEDPSSLIKELIFELYYAPKSSNPVA